MVVVEHDEETIRAADHVIDFGPGAGVAGGRVVHAGTPASLERNAEVAHGRLPLGPPRDRGAREARARRERQPQDRAARARTT